jgi:conjugal transfer/entry exclusion protein
MIHDKISLVLKDINVMKDKLRDVKSDMRKEEKVTREDYLELKKAYKDMRAQLKDIEDEWQSELAEDEMYNKLREIRMKLEEDVAHAREKLFEYVAQLPVKAFQMSVETESGPVNVNIQPEMKVYMNGKEEKGKF